MSTFARKPKKRKIPSDSDVVGVERWENTFVEVTRGERRRRMQEEIDRYKTVHAEPRQYEPKQDKP